MPNNTSSQSTTPQPPTRMLAVDGGSIAYDVQGSGPLVLLVPGMGDLRSAYRFLTPQLVAAGYTVATTDLRGHGDSDATFPTFGDEETASDIEALIGELGAPAVIVGNSMAAGAAVIVAATRPELINGLVLVGPFVREQTGNGFAMVLFRIMTARPWAAAVWKAYMPTLYSGVRPTDFAEYREKVITSIKRPGYTSAFSKTTRLNHVRAGESLAAVEAPTLVVMGDKDPDFKNPRAEAEWIAHELHGTAVMVADAGHYPQSQQPELTAAAVIPFLASLKNNA
jgi:pimeloyl-ACP methyl ester carboxylesterase